MNKSQCLFPAVLLMTFGVVGCMTVAPPPNPVGGYSRIPLVDNEAILYIHTACDSTSTHDWTHVFVDERELVYLGGKTYTAAYLPDGTHNIRLSFESNGVNKYTPSDVERSFEAIGGNSYYFLIKSYYSIPKANYMSVNPLMIIETVDNHIDLIQEESDAGLYKCGIVDAFPNFSERNGTAP